MPNTQIVVGAPVVGPRWEYCVESGFAKRAGSLQETLNRLGSEGWELAGTTQVTGGGVSAAAIVQYIFKRELR